MSTPNRFRSFSAGVDDLFGNVVGGTNDTSGPPPSYFVYPTGDTFVASETATSVSAMISSSRYESSGTDVNDHLDNLTNFSNGTLDDDLP
ncbi:MAG: hypothetical protein R3C05_17250 [Pirellulaceae bacterium]